MSRCRQCNIEVLDETERCPLCHSVLEPTIEVENMYPDVKIKTRRMMLLSRIYLFVAIVAEAVLVAVNHYGDFETAWSLVTGLIFFYGYLVVRFAILGKTGYIAKTIVLTLIAILILIAIDFVSGYRGWSVRYVFPAAIIQVTINDVQNLYVTLELLYPEHPGDEFYKVTQWQTVTNNEPVIDDDSLHLYQGN